MSAVNFDEFSDEIMLRIFGYLSPHDLCRIAPTCKCWDRLTKDNSFWKKFALEHFPDYQWNLKDSNWKDLYRKEFTFLRNFEKGPGRYVTINLPFLGDSVNFYRLENIVIAEGLQTLAYNKDTGEEISYKDMHKSLTCLTRRTRCIFNRWTSEISLHDTRTDKVLRYWKLPLGEELRAYLDGIVVTQLGNLALFRSYDFTVKPGGGGIFCPSRKKIRLE